MNPLFYIIIYLVVSTTVTFYMIGRYMNEKGIADKGVLPFLGLLITSILLGWFLLPLAIFKKIAAFLYPKS